MTDNAPVAKDSPVARLDPRVRIACAFLTAFAVAAMQNLFACSLALGASLLTLALARPVFRPLLSRLLAVNAFVLLAALLLPFTVQDAPTGAAVAFSLSPSQRGLRLALLVSLKANAISIWFMALAGSIDPARLGYAMERLRVPKKLVFLFIFTLRFIHTIATEWKTLTTSAKLRGFVPSCTVHGYRTTGALLGVLLLRSNSRARRVHEAMLLRGFNGHFCSVSSFKASLRDFLFLCSLICFLALLAVLELGIIPSAF